MKSFETWWKEQIKDNPELESIRFPVEWGWVACPQEMTKLT